MTLFRPSFCNAARISFQSKTPSPPPYFKEIYLPPPLPPIDGSSGFRGGDDIRGQTPAFTSQLQHLAPLVEAPAAARVHDDGPRLRLGVPDPTVQTRVVGDCGASADEDGVCVIALDCGPDSVVLTPGASDRAESSDVAKVRVTNGRELAGAGSSCGCSPGAATPLANDDGGTFGGSQGSSLAAWSAGK
ncbi:hypothetical protein PspLS_06812, partial [Pyricularia sp. CBS 133598]